MMKVLDNFFTEEILNKLLTDYNNSPMRYGWLSHEQNDPHGHWFLDFGKTNSKNLSDVSNNIPEFLLHVKNYITDKIDILDNTVLIRCYIGGHTFGVDGYYHTDSTRSDEITFVFYLVEGKWEFDWGGETSFITPNEEVFSVIPKKNRVVIFQSNIQHCARGVSRKYNGLRKTLMFKFRRKRSDNFEKLSRFLVKHNALNYNHMIGSLHDHLVRTYQLLENGNLPEHVCFAAGLHSVFGTTIYRNQLLKLEDKDLIINEFGEKTFVLVSYFSRINRPKTLETYVDNNIEFNDGSFIKLDDDIILNLKYIECANLEDQKSLNIEKYPNLYNLWYNNVK